MKTLPWILVAATCWVLSWCQTTTPAPEIPLDDVAKKCLAQENVSKAYLIDFIYERINPATVSQNMKCFTRCTLETRNLMKNGIVIEANLVKAAENISTVAQVRRILADCGVKKGKDVCETSFNIFMCISSEL